MIDGKVAESVVAAGAGRFRRQALPPVIAAHVVADLDLVRAVHTLNRQAAIADQFAIRFQNHCPEPMAVVGVAPQVAGDPFFDSGVSERRGIETHGFRVGENAS
ncbi:MAG: hypothetical protein WB683_12580 [Candidatus Sulfotelmatobacter sp.]